MKKSIFPAILLLVALTVATTTSSQVFAFDWDVASEGWVAEFEAMAMRYDRASGVNGAVTGTDVNSDYELAPRITVGYVTPEGLGIRMRYFDYEQYASTNANAEGYDVDVNTFDVEFFERIDISSLTSVEWSAGVRYNDYREVFVRQNGAPFLTNNFHGLGLTAALEVTRQVHWGSVFARGRGALLTGDATVDPPGPVVGPTNINDTTRGMLELALGWEIDHQLNNGMWFTFGVGYEMQNWFNYSPINTNLGTPGGVVPPMGDVGLDGILISFTLEN